MVLVFHLSHLLLRMLLIHDSEKSYILFSRLHMHQTQQMILKCAHLMPFEHWQCYVQALQAQPES